MHTLLPRSALMKFTVLLLYPDYLAATYGHDTYCTVVAAPTVPEAIVKAQTRALEDATLCPINLPDADPVDFYCLAVFRGDHQDVRPNTATLENQNAKIQNEMACPPAPPPPTLGAYADR